MSHRLVLPRLAAGCVLAAGLSGAAQAALFDRGGGLIYDSDLNVTWLKDANYAKTSGYDADGKMTWTNAVTWAANLSYFDAVRNVTYTDWRLPTTTDTGAPGCDFSYSGTDCGYNVDPASSEMAHLYFVELGNQSYWTTTATDSGAYSGGANPNSTLDNVGPFTNFQSYPYWSGTEHALDSSAAWVFGTADSFQRGYVKTASLYALAVRPGDIANLLPVSLIGGPYAINQGQNLLLNGVASYDPDYVADSIVQYAWDLNGDATYDVFGATPDVDPTTLAGLGMGAGTYTLALKVTDTHGTYGVNTTSLTITAVPEPGTYAMMLAGLGLVGVAARRRGARG